MTRTAQRWIATGPGDLDVLRLVEQDLPDPGPGEVLIEVRAVGMNPADFKHLARASPPADGAPLPIGYEVSGVIAALGPDTTIASGGGAPGDEVLAFRIAGAYASAVVVPAADVFAKPPALDHPAAANLLLAATTAAEMLAVTGVAQGETVVLHGASGAVGVSVLQQARPLGVRVLGTASPSSADTVRRFGGIPVAYGDGLEDRLRQLAPEGFDAALDGVGTAEAVDVSLALVTDRERIVTIAAPDRAAEEGFRAIAGALPQSKAFRAQARARLVDLAGRGELVVPVARTFPLTEAVAALRLLKSGHPGGKLALVP